MEKETGWITESIFGKGIQELLEERRKDNAIIIAGIMRRAETKQEQQAGQIGGFLGTKAVDWFVDNYTEKGKARVAAAEGADERGQAYRDYATGDVKGGLAAEQLISGIKEFGEVGKNRTLIRELESDIFINKQPLDVLQGMYTDTLYGDNKDYNLAQKISKRLENEGLAFITTDKGEEWVKDTSTKSGFSMESTEANAPVEPNEPVVEPRKPVVDVNNIKDSVESTHDIMDENARKKEKERTGGLFNT